MKPAYFFAFLILFALIATAPASPPEAFNPQDYATVNASLVDTRVLPRYKHLKTTTSDFLNASRSYCFEPDKRELAAVRMRFHETMDAWMGIQHIRFGPVEFLMRNFRFYLWPQARGKVAQTVFKTIETADGGDRFAGEIQKANVAVQGLLAAEFLLFDRRYLGTDIGTRQKGCGLLMAVARNMQAMAGNILSEWQQGDDVFARLVKMPGTESPFMQTHAEVTLAFFQGFHDSLQLVVDVNLKPVIGKGVQEIRPALAESRLSGRSQRNIAVVLEPCRHLMALAGKPVLAASPQWPTRTSTG